MPCGSSFMRSPTISATSCARWQQKLIKIGAKVVSHGRYVAFQMAEVAFPRQMFQEILRLIAELRSQPPPAARADQGLVADEPEGAEDYCNACHSLDYPRMNAPFLNRQGWETEVNKMITAFGAPIGPSDAKTIVDYLVANYGSGK